MDVLPNPAKEAINRRKHGLDFSRVGKIFDLPYSVEIDDRPLGYEHEVRLKLIGFLGGRVVVLVYQEVEISEDDMAARPISLRYTTRGEARTFWTAKGGP
jgi:uncharacterized DUF497 family protein